MKMKLIRELEKEIEQVYKKAEFVNNEEGKNHFIKIKRLLKQVKKEQEEFRLLRQYTIKKFKELQKALDILIEFARDDFLKKLNALGEKLTGKEEK